MKDCTEARHRPGRVDPAPCRCRGGGTGGKAAAEEKPAPVPMPTPAPAPRQVLKPTQGKGKKRPAQPEEAGKLLSQ